ncbi:hypothetical protein Ae201684P_021203 [Aphanomyces euteiches]|nr:hypothetical protein Ae201684P_021203 [Aphanomyces euteiches]
MRVTRTACTQSMNPQPLQTPAKAVGALDQGSSPFAYEHSPAPEHREWTIEDRMKPLLECESKPYRDDLVVRPHHVGEYKYSTCTTTRNGLHVDANRTRALSGSGYRYSIASNNAVHLSFPDVVVALAAMPVVGEKIAHVSQPI